MYTHIKILPLLLYCQKPVPFSISISLDPEYSDRSELFLRSQGHIVVDLLLYCQLMLKPSSEMNFIIFYRSQWYWVNSHVWKVLKVYNPCLFESYTMEGTSRKPYNSSATAFLPDDNFLFFFFESACLWSYDKLQFQHFKLNYINHTNW